MPWPQRILLSGWFFYVFLIPFWSMFPLKLIGPAPTLVQVVAYLIGSPLAKRRLARTARYGTAAIDLKTKDTPSIGGFAVVSAGGGGFSSGGSFSRGGGSSGGGGASGSW